MLHDSPNQTRLIAKVIRELLASQSYGTLADLTSAVKARCARLRLKVSPDTLNGAYVLIASNTALVTAEVVEDESPVSLPPPDLKAAEEQQLYREIMARYASEQLPVPSPGETGPGRPDDFPDLVLVRS